MNTLVDLNDGAQAPETKDEVAPRAPGHPTAAARPSDATLIELAAPPSGPGADNATLIELAPASGRTLILPDGPAQELRRALANTSVTVTGPATVPAAPIAGSRAQRLLARALGAPPGRARLKRLAPFAVGVASLLITAIPLWSRSPPSPARGGAAIERLPAASAAPPAASPPAAEPVAPPPPGESAGEPGAQEAGRVERAHAAAARSLVDRRRRTRGAIASRWKGHGQVLRTRNGAPVVD